MATKQIIVQRFSVTSSKSFQDVVSRLEAAVGHPGGLEHQSLEGRGEGLLRSLLDQRLDPDPALHVDAAGAGLGEGTGGRSLTSR